MTPLELLFETCAEWLIEVIRLSAEWSIELIHLHNWTVVFVPIFGTGVFLAGFFIGKGKAYAKTTL